MSDKENTTKVEDVSHSSAAEANEELLSLDDLDSVIAEADPEFLESLSTIGPENANEIYAEGADLKFTLEDEQKLWQEGGPLQHLLLKVLPFLPALSYKAKLKRTAFRIFLVQVRANFLEHIKGLPHKFVGFLKGLGAKIKHGIGQGLQTFKDYSLKEKLSFVGLIVVSIASAVFIALMFKRGLIPADKEMFLGSLSEIAQAKYPYTSQTSMESFYESTRMTQNILLLKKMIVNLKPSSESGANPMGAFEFFVEGTVSEVVVEVKDREAEMTDLIQRTISDMSFDQVASGEGKQLLCERIRKEMNTVLTQGFVRRVFIKTAIVKP